MDEYQLTENEAQAHCVEFANVTDLRRQVAEIRAKIRALGNVNVGAIAEYKEVKERYDFLKAQVGDVERSKAELTRMIGELCREMEAMFTKSLQGDQPQLRPYLPRAVRRRQRPALSV